MRRLSKILLLTERECAELQDRKLRPGRGGVGRLSAEDRTRAVIEEHLAWVAYHGSLRAAVASSERDFSEAKIKRWYDARAKTIAGKTAQSNAYYLNTKKYPQRRSSD